MEDFEMTYKDLKKKIKEEQKALALEIRRGKFLRKPDNRGDITEDDKDLYYSYDGFSCWKVDNLSNEYRHKHIAYCILFNNTPYGLIESPRDDNKASTSTIDFYKKEWEDQLDEALRDCA